MLKKSMFILIMVMLISPAANIFAEEKQHKSKEHLKKQPRTRIQKLEQRLVRIEKMLQQRSGPRQKAIKGKKQQPTTRIQKMEERLERIEKMLQQRSGARQKALKGKKQQPKEHPQRERFQQGRVKMQEWFEQIERAYDENDMEKIGRLIKKGNKFREQMKQHREEFRGRRGAPRGGREGRGAGRGKEMGLGRGFTERQFDCPKTGRGRREGRGAGRGKEMGLRRGFAGRQSDCPKTCRGCQCPNRQRRGKQEQPRRQRQLRQQRQHGWQDQDSNRKWYW